MKKMNSWGSPRVNSFKFINILSSFGDEITREGKLVPFSLVFILA